jgi:hypothetical protein
MQCKDSSRRKVNLPKYYTARDLMGTHWTLPFFTFPKVSMRVFPLRADALALQKLLDDTLNIIPPEIGFFRAALPYVFLLVVDYGHMSVDAENLGWLSQHEVVFAVPLAWYKQEGEKTVFKGWAGTSPFIFVDNELSMATGREVYGWPKAIAQFAPQVSSWLKDPISPDELMTVRTRLFSDPYKANRVEQQVLFRIEQDRIQRVAKLPLGSDNPLLPWNSIPKVIQGVTSLLGDYVDTISYMELLRGQPKTGVLRYLKKGWQLRDVFKQLEQHDNKLNVIQLKQFRDAARPQLACYQAITQSQLKVERVNSGGLLSAGNTLLGDISGGFRIFMHHHASLPIVDTLGLEVAEETRIEDRRISTIRPVLPFWLDVDMSYDVGDYIAQRAHHPKWYEPCSETRRDEEPIQDKEAGIPLCTAAGMAAQTCSGPFVFPNMTLRVLPLLADHAKLVDFCNRYLNDPLKEVGIRFDPWGDYVYLVASNHEDMTSSRSNVGHWAGQDVICYLPVREFKCSGRDGEGKELRGVALVPVFAYTDSDISANSSSEVNGIRKVKASIKSPPTTWMGNSGPSDSAGKRFLELRTLVLPVMGLGQKSEERTLLEIHAGNDVLPNNSDHLSWSFVAASWEERLLEEVESRCRRAYNNLEDQYREDGDLLYAHSVRDEVGDAFALALELLGNKKPLRTVTLKQIRDVATPEKACYQALVEVDQVFDNVFDIQEIEELIHVYIHHYPSQPMVEELGLVTKSVKSKGASLVHKLEPIRPFWMRVSMRTELGRNLLWRVDSQWRVGGDPQVRYLDEENENRLGSGRQLLRHLRSPQRLSHQLQQWYAERANAGKEPPEMSRLSRGEAQRALDAVDPQMLIELMLSNELENWGSDPRIIGGKGKKPDFCVHKDRVKHLIANADKYRTWVNGATAKVSEKMVSDMWYVPPFSRWLPLMDKASHAVSKFSSGKWGMFLEEVEKLRNLLVEKAMEMARQDIGQEMIDDELEKWSRIFESACERLMKDYMHEWRELPEEDRRGVFTELMMMLEAQKSEEEIGEYLRRKTQKTKAEVR